RGWERGGQAGVVDGDEHGRPLLVRSDRQGLGPDPLLDPLRADFAAGVEVAAEPDRLLGRDVDLRDAHRDELALGGPGEGGRARDGATEQDDERSNRHDLVALPKMDALPAASDATSGGKPDGAPRRPALGAIGAAPAPVDRGAGLPLPRACAGALPSGSRRQRVGLTPALEGEIGGRLTSWRR